MTPCLSSNLLNRFASSFFRSAATCRAFLLSDLVISGVSFGTMIGLRYGANMSSTRFRVVYAQWRSWWYISAREVHEMPPTYGACVRDLFPSAVFWSEGHALWYS